MSNLKLKLTQLKINKLKDEIAQLKKGNIICDIKGKPIPRKFIDDWKVGRISHNRFSIVKNLKKASELSRCKKGNRSVGFNSQITDVGLSGRKLKKGNFLVTWKKIRR